MKSSLKQKEWKRLNHIKKREYFRNRNKTRKASFRDIIREVKNRPCADCGQSFPHYVMDLHHNDGEDKRYNVSAVWAISSKEKLLEEIAKCEVVCANCHRIRTHAE